MCGSVHVQQISGLLATVVSERLVRYRTSRSISLFLLRVSVQSSVSGSVRAACGVRGEGRRHLGAVQAAVLAPATCAAAGGRILR